MNLVALFVALLVAAPPAELKSGLQRGEEVAAWNPIHVAGPDKGTRACPVCTYLEKPAIVIFMRDGDNAAALAEQLERLVAANEAKGLKGFVIVLDATPEKVAKMAADRRITKIGVCYPDPQTKDKDLELYKVHPQALNTIILYRDYKVTANFVNLERTSSTQSRRRSSQSCPDGAWLKGSDNAQARERDDSCRGARPGGLFLGGSRPAARKPAAPSSVATTARGIPLTPQNTRIEFVGSSERKSQSGSFQQFTGTFEAKGDDLQTARMALDIDMDSTTTTISLLTRHLKGKDFFDVPQYPRASFVSTSIQPSPTPESSHVITGSLTMHGVTRPISAPANITLANGILTFTSRFVIRQSEFGMTEALKKSKDEVPVTISIHGSRT